MVERRERERETKTKRENKRAKEQERKRARAEQHMSAQDRSRTESRTEGPQICRFRELDLPRTPLPSSLAHTCVKVVCCVEIFNVK